MASSGTTTRTRSRSTQGKGDIDESPVTKERGSTTSTTEFQEEMERELRASMQQREHSTEAFEELTETIDRRFDSLPADIAAAFSTAMADQFAKAGTAIAKDAQELRRVLEGREGRPLVQIRQEDDRFFLVRWADGAWQVLKPRKPHLEDIAPAAYSNAATWGAAYLLSQMSGGVSEFLVDLFSQGGDLTA